MKLWESKDFKDSDLAEKVERFTASGDIAFDQFLIKYDIVGSLAHATMLNKAGVLSKEELAGIKKSLKNAMLMNKEGRFKIEQKDEDVHTKIENYLTDELGETGKKIHTGRSRNDQILVDMRLYAKDNLLDIEEAILNLCKSLLRFSAENKGMPMPGYTHMQKAMPSSVGLWAASYIEALLDDMIMVRCAYKLNNQNPLGSAAGYGVSLNIDRHFTTKLLGFEKIQNNVLYVQNSRGKIEAVLVSALATVMLDLSRLANDIILFSTKEFGFFEIPEELCTGSSIMPKKRNPDILELVRARSNIVFSFFQQLVGTVKDLTSGYNRDLQETKEPVIRSVYITESSLKMCDLVIKNLKVNESMLMRAFTPEIFSVDKAMELVKKGVPFRDAYKEVQYNFQNVGHVDPKYAIKAKKYSGTTGMLGLKRLGKTIEKEEKSQKSERESFDRILNSLLA